MILRRRLLSSPFGKGGGGIAQARRSDDGGGFARQPPLLPTPPFHFAICDLPICYLLPRLPKWHPRLFLNKQLANPPPRFGDRPSQNPCFFSATRHFPLQVHLSSHPPPAPNLPCFRYVMLPIRPIFSPSESPASPDGGTCPIGGPTSGPTSGRLNLLLSYAGWHQDPWVDRLPKLLEPMGVQSHRAGSGRQAQDVIKNIPIHIAVVDLGLPLEAQPAPDASLLDSAPELEEGGARLLELLHRMNTPPPTVVVKRARSTRDDHRDMAQALRMGAFAVVDRPHDAHDLNVLLEVLRRCLCRFYQGRWPGGLAT